MTRTIFARRTLADSAPLPHEASLLLEGSWPADSSAWHESLDDDIDGRFEWIDLQASHWSEQLGRAASEGDGSDPLDAITAGYLNADSLRYTLVKLLRLVAYLTEIRPLEPGGRIDLVVQRRRDEDYADLLAELTRAAGAALCVHWRGNLPRPEPEFPVNGRLRRWLGRAARWIEPGVGDRDYGHRVVFCGNPRILDPVCAELVARRCRVWWLYDRFAMRSWWKWRRAGVGQLMCDSSVGRRNRLSNRLPERLLFRQIDLVPAIGHWLAERMRTHGRMQTRVIEMMDAHFRRVRPDALVLSEDVTPLARAAVALARRHGATSHVLQHAAPVHRFAYAPLVADRFLAWGDATRRHLVDWGVPAERIEITGSPQHDAWAARFRRDVERVEAARGRLPAVIAGWPWLVRQRPVGRGISVPVLPRPAAPEGEPSQPTAPRILVLGTVPPDDGQPYVTALHFNSRTYAAMWQSVFAAVQGRPGARLVVKIHPRSPRDPFLDAALRAHPAVPVEMVRAGAPWDLAAKADCALSFASSAGVEVAQAGVPVIQVLPSGSGDVLPPERWGLVGSARNRAQLEELLDRVLGGAWQPPNPTDGRVLDNFDRPAAARAADAILRADRRASSILGPRGESQRHPAEELTPA